MTGASLFLAMRDEGGGRRKGGLVGEGFEGEVKAFDVVSEGANGDEVNATFGVGADGVDGNATT